MQSDQDPMGRKVNIFMPELLPLKLIPINLTNIKKNTGHNMYYNILFFLYNYFYHKNKCTNEYEL